MAPCSTPRRSRCRLKRMTACPFSSYPVQVVLPAEVLAHDLFEDPPRLDRPAAPPSGLISSAELLAYGEELDRQAAARDFFNFNLEDQR